MWDWPGSNQWSPQSHRAVPGKRETPFYLVLLKTLVKFTTDLDFLIMCMDLLYMKLIKEMFVSLKWLLSLKNDFQIASNKSAKINKYFFKKRGKLL